MRNLISSLVVTIAAMSLLILTWPGYARHPQSVPQTANMLAAKSTWVWTSPLHGAREAHTATLLSNGEVFVSGGGGWFLFPNGNGGGVGVQGSAELYSPVSRTWRVAEPPNISRRWGVCSTLLPNGRVLVAGGVWPEIGR